MQAQRTLLTSNTSELVTNLTALSEVTTAVVADIAQVWEDPNIDTAAYTPECAAFVHDYIGIVKSMVSNDSIPAATRFEAVAQQTGAVVQVAQALSGSTHRDDSFAVTLSQGLLDTAQSLSRVVDSANSTTGIETTVDLNESPSMPGGFVTAVNLSNTSQTVLNYPRNNQAVNEASKVTGFSINASRVVGARANTSVSLAATVVEFSNDALFPDNTSGTSVVSSVLLASLGVPVSGLADEDRICGTYRHAASSTHANASSEPRCVYYDHGASAWSLDGCKATFTNTTHITCCCNHLTAFAVVVGGESTSSEDAAALEGITFVGLGLSLFCLLITIFTIAASEEMLLQLQNKLIIQLALSLSVSHLLFFFITSPTDPEQCRVLSLSLMYFLLVSFAWMSVQSHCLYTTFVMVNVWNVSRHGDLVKLVRYCVFAWGFPLALVLGGAFVDNPGTITTVVSGSTETVQYCWIDRDSTIKWFFLGPMLASVFYNTVAAIRVILAVFHQLKRQNRRDMDSTFKDKLLQLVKDIKVVCVIASVTGAGWISAVLVVFQIGGIVAQYIFTILTAFQGILIFNFHVLQKQPGRASLQGMGRRVMMTLSKSSSGPRKVVRGNRTNISSGNSSSGGLKWRRAGAAASHSPQPETSNNNVWKITASAPPADRSTAPTETGSALYETSDNMLDDCHLQRTVSISTESAQESDCDSLCTNDLRSAADSCESVLDTPNNDLDCTELYETSQPNGSHSTV